jgi:hypothetical protein
MPTANYDSSELTRRIRARTLGLYSRELQAARTSNYLIVRREQGGAQDLDTVTQRLQGSCVCVDSYVRHSVPEVNYAGN